MFMYNYRRGRASDRASDKTEINGTQMETKTEVEKKEEKTVVQHWPVVAANLPALNHADRLALDCPVLPPVLAHQATQQHLLWHLSVVGRYGTGGVVVVEVVVKDLDSWFFDMYFFFRLGTVRFGLRASNCWKRIYAS